MRVRIRRFGVLRFTLAGSAVRSRRESLGSLIHSPPERICRPAGPSSLQLALPAWAPRWRSSDTLVAPRLVGFRPPLRLVLRRHVPSTTTSADFSLRLTSSSFQTQGEISPGKAISLRRAIAGSTCRCFDHTGLRDSEPARPASTRLYPISVRRPAVSLHASFGRLLAVAALRFASVSVI